MTELYYLSNTRRGTVAWIDLSEIDLSSQPDVILEKYQKNGYPNAVDRSKLYAVVDKKFIRFSEVQNLEAISRVIYSDVVAHQNAVEFGRENGIVYFFHTSEKSHQDFPHVHAKYAEEEISIYLKEFGVIGRFKSKKKQKEALEYVKKHLQELQDEWNRIIDA